MLLSGDRRERTVALHDLLDGYTEFRRFDPRELRLVEALRSLRMIHYAGWLARRWDDPAFPRAFPWFNTQRYWEEHILSLKEQYAALDEPALEWQES
jgi:Ser/Thr protein kinase RdoA (MazF antagonist)